jgi:predicted nucleotidyltransferase
MIDFKALLRALADGGVEFILVGGVAATIHGAARLTVDVDVVYRRAGENLERIALALTPYHPYLRGAPPGLPFRWDRATIQRGLNFTLTTDLGDLDMLGEIVGGGTYEDLLPHTIGVQVFGVQCRCLDLRRLIDVKRAAGRPKDVEAVAELEALLEERERADREREA